MLISLLVLLVPVVVLIGGYQVLSGRTDPVAVDQTGVLSQARSAGLPVAEPAAGLGPEWVPVSGVFEREPAGETLRLGFASPDGESVQLLQSSIPARTLLAERYPDAGSPTGEVIVDGERWQVYSTRPGEQALLLASPDLTVLVVGTAAEPELREAAAALTGR